MRSSFLGSSLAHLGFLIALFAVPAVPTIVVPGPDVVQVALVDPVALRPQPPPRPPREPEPRAAAIAPTEETGVKLAPPKPVRKKKEEPEKREPAPETAGPVLPYAPVGRAGLSGQISVTAGNFEFTYYLVLLRNRIAQNWTPPAGLVTGGQPVRAVVYFKIARGGEISAVRLEEASPVEFFDRSALRAVIISHPLPPLPLGFSGSDLGVHFGFEYSPP